MLSRATTTAATVSIGGFIFGFDAAVISGVIGPVTQNWSLDSLLQGWVVSAPTVAGMIATPLIGPLADAIGRKKVLILLAALYAVSAGVSALAPSVTWLVLARFVGGVAFGSLMLAPIYIAEISDQNERGRLVSFNQFNIVIGFSAAYFSNYFILESSGPSAWRWMLGIEVLPALMWLGLLMGIPESPRWLRIQGRTQEADGIAKRFGLALDQIADTEAVATFAERARTLLSPRLRFAIVLGLIVGIVQQATGVNAIFFYAPTIFEQSGVGTNAAFAQATLVGIINVVFTIAAMLLIDRLGRRPLLLIGTTGVALSTGLTAYCFSVASYSLTADDLAVIESTIAGSLLPIQNVVYSSDVEFQNPVIVTAGNDYWIQHQATVVAAAIDINAGLVLVGILGFVASFAISLGPVMWVLFSEIFPNQIRGLAVAFVGFFNSVTSFTVQFVFPWELESLGAATTFTIYSIIAVVAIVLIWRLLPETKQKSLEEIEVMLARAKAPAATSERA